MSTFVTVHAIQSVPPSNINRDRNGSPKSSIFGGSRRHQVSSQSWKRAIKKYLSEIGADGGTLSSRSFVRAVVEKIAARRGIDLDLDTNPENVEVVQSIVDQVALASIISGNLSAAAMSSQGTKARATDEPKKKNNDDEDSAEVDEDSEEIEADIEGGVVYYKTNAAFPFTGQTVEAFADIVEEIGGIENYPYKIEVNVRDSKAKKLVTKVSANRLEKAGAAAAKAYGKRLEGVVGAVTTNIALFGRMFASNPSLNVDAAVQVAYALAVHETAPQTDFYTAVDDLAEAGASMMGTTEYDASVLYRNASLNLDELKKSLPEANIEEIVGAFIEAFALSMPKGAINSHGNSSLPAVVLVSVGKRAVNHSSAYLDAVEDDFLAESTRRLIAREETITRRLGGVSGGVILSLDETVDDLVQGSDLDVADSISDLSERVVSLIGE